MHVPGTLMNENHRGPLLALILSFSQREKGHEEGPFSYQSEVLVGRQAQYIPQ